MKFDKNPEVGSGGNFLKLKDGEEIIGILRGEVLEFTSKIVDNRWQTCDMMDDGAKFRFRVNFVPFKNISEGFELQPKIWEQGPTIYHILKGLADDYEMSQTVIKVKRNGTGRDTQYTIIPSGKFKLTPELEKQLQAIELLDLKPKGSSGASDFGDPPHVNSEDIPF